MHVGFAAGPIKKTYTANNITKENLIALKINSKKYPPSALFPLAIRLKFMGVRTISVNQITNKIISNKEAKMLFFSV